MTGPAGRQERPSLAAALPAAARYGVSTGRSVSPSLQVRRLPVPTVPPPGGLLSVGGFLLARAAPFDRDVQQVCWAAWGVGQVSAGQRGTCASRTRDARRRLAELGRRTPVPPVLLMALAGPAAGGPLVRGLAKVYGLRAAPGPGRRRQPPGPGGC